MNSFFRTSLLLISVATATISLADNMLDVYLRKEFPNAKVKSAETLGECQPEKILLDGVSKLYVECTNGESKRLNLSGKVSVLTPNRRIGPGENLREEQFDRQEIDLFHPAVFPYRHLLIGNLEKISEMESRQTLLVGQPLLSSHFSEKPLIRLGESVAVRILVGDLVIQTMGIAQEKGLKNALIRVLTKNTKKDLVGKVMEDHTVEVNL